MKKTFTLLLLLFTSLTVFSQDISGAWTGSLDIQGNKLYLIFNIKNNSGSYSATLDSPSQGAKDIPVTRVSFIDSKLIMEIDGPQITYEGVYTNAAFKGTFKQSGFELPMDLSKDMPVMNRPQEPKGPFPYYSEDVTFTNKKENFILAGTLTLPQKEGNFPVVVLISGSGPQDRNSEIFGHKSFWVIADYLTRKGIAVLRVDDRGIGQSKGDRSKSTTKDFATDTQAAVEYLKTRKEINIKKIGLIGHSEGGLIAPMIAAENPKDIAFIVLMAGSGTPGKEVLLEQNNLIGKASGMSEEELAAAYKTNKSIYDILQPNADSNNLKKQLHQLLKVNFDSAPENEKPSEKEQNEIINGQIAVLTSPWYMYFINYDPAIVLKNVKCPVLVLNGDQDFQVSAQTNVSAIKNALEKSGNKKVTSHIFPKMNHLFQECKTCTLAEYGLLEQTIAPEVLQEISQWITNQVK